MEERKKLVIEIIERKVDGEPECDITEKTRLKEDLWMDSLDAVDLKYELEEKFGITIPDDISDDFETVQDILNYLDKVLPEN